MANRIIPVVDLGKFTKGDAASRASFVKEIGSAFQNIGFVGVVNHGVPKELIDSFYKASKEFFAQPTELKRKYEVAGAAGQRGYTSFGKEHAKQSKLPDLKEFFQIGQELEPGVDMGEMYLDNVEVEELPEFTKLGIQLYRKFEESGAQLLKAIALYLDLEEDYFDSKTEIKDKVSNVY